MKAHVLLYLADDGKTLKVFNEGIFTTAQCALNSISPLEGTPVYGPFDVEIPCVIKNDSDKPRIDLTSLKPINAGAFQPVKEAVLQAA